MIELPYRRADAADYAVRWAMHRNPKYADFESMGGDCTNFVSQCLFAGSGVMNYTPTFGWYYNSLNNRAPAWSGVNELFRFLTRNDGVGPYGYETDFSEMEVGDIIQLNVNSDSFHHTAIIDSVRDGEFYLSAHTYDAVHKPLFSYFPKQIRMIHIAGVRSWE